MIFQWLTPVTLSILTCGMKLEWLHAPLISPASKNEELAETWSLALHGQTIGTFFSWLWINVDCLIIYSDFGTVGVGDEQRGIAAPVVSEFLFSTVKTNSCLVAMKKKVKANEYSALLFLLCNPPPCPNPAWQTIDWGTWIGLENIMLNLSSLFSCERRQTKERSI